MNTYNLHDLVLPWPSERIPRYLWTVCKRARQVFLACVVFMGIGVLAWNKYAGVFILGTCVFGLVVRMVIQRLVRLTLLTIAERDWKCCDKCGYYLDTLPPKYCCPECGSAYDIKEIRYQWKRIAGLKQQRELT